MIDPEAAGDEDHAVGEFRRVEQIEGLGIGLAPRDRAVAGDADRTDVVPVRIIKARGGVASRRRLAMGHLLFAADLDPDAQIMRNRSEEHTSELQSLMRISYAVFCLIKKRLHN